MKKLFLTLCVALLSLGAQAQERGDFAVGLRGGASIYTLRLGDFSENVTQFGIGVFGQYNLSRHFRLDLEGIYHPKTDHTTDFQVGLDVQYLIHVSDDFKIFPLVGYSLAFQHTDTFTDTSDRGSITVEGGNNTDGGVQVGLGLQYNFGDNWFASAEYRFQPGIFGNAHVVLGSVGYRF